MVTHENFKSLLPVNSTLRLVEELVTEFQQTPELLVIDDDPIYVEIFTKILEKCGCKVDSARSSVDAEILIEDRHFIRKPYDLIFLDLYIPTRNGPEILRCIREKMPEVPVVVVTGYPDSTKVQEALQYGYLGLVKKPLDFHEIERIFSSYKIALPTNPQNHK
jgi:DNA-binding NtrC family response regulator